MVVMGWVGAAAMPLPSFDLFDGILTPEDVTQCRENRKGRLSIHGEKPQVAWVLVDGWQQLGL
jgi:hypothetical protein